MKLKAKISISLVFLFIFLICITGCSKKPKNANQNKYEKITARLEDKNNDEGITTGNIEIIFENNQAKNILLIVEYSNTKLSKETYFYLKQWLEYFDTEDIVKIKREKSKVFIDMEGNDFKYIYNNYDGDLTKESIKRFLSTNGYKIIDESEYDKDSFDINLDVQDNVYLAVYIVDNATQEEINDVNDKLRKMDGVISIDFISKEEAYQNAVERLGKSSIDLAGYTEKQHPFPRYFLIQVDNNVDTESLLKELKNIDIVIDADYTEDMDEQ